MPDHVKTALGRLTALALALSLVLTGCAGTRAPGASQAGAAPESSAWTWTDTAGGAESSAQVWSIDQLPDYAGEPYVDIDGGVPDFEPADLTTTAWESYSELDALGRCGPAQANIGVELMPTQERGSIGQVKPSGWHLATYDFVDGRYLYNRCHLIGYQLSGENANERNLITGTRYLNVVGMLPFEELVADYVRETEHHVLYRVTPIFRGDDLLASGVQMEALSVEDDGAGVCFNVYVYNVQPGVVIDYATGDNRAETSASQPPAQATSTPAPEETPAPSPEAEVTYILNTNTMRFHYPSCPSVDDIKDHNRQDYTGDRDALIDQGYVPCGRCKP